MSIQHIALQPEYQILRVASPRCTSITKHHSEAHRSCRMIARCCGPHRRGSEVYYLHARCQGLVGNADIEMALQREEDGIYEEPCVALTIPVSRTKKVLS